MYVISVISANLAKCLTLILHDLKYHSNRLITDLRVSKHCDLFLQAVGVVLAVYVHSAM